MTDLTAYRVEITDRIIESAVNPNDQSALTKTMTIGFGNLLN